jgi:pimeloyl-ACP methyl ester carboxylesterase
MALFCHLPLDHFLLGGLLAMTMKQALQTRALITLDGADVKLRATYHKPSDRRHVTDLRESANGRIGVVFINALSTPRAGLGDSMVYWAEALADCGYPSFRFDLPGLGDTCGDIPMELLTFITKGGYASVFTDKLQELTESFNLSGVVIVGHCAGAVTALYSASEAKACKGLILMDPYFDFAKRVVAQLPSEFVSWSRRSKIGEVLRNSYDIARELPRAIRKDGLPPSANPALLDQWRQVASGGMPILVLRSPGKEPRAGQFDYMKHAVSLAGREARVAIKLLADADHSFANGIGRDAVRRQAEEWLSELFPQAATTQSLAAPAISD